MFHDLLDSLRYHLLRKPLMAIAAGRFISYLAFYLCLAGLFSKVAVQAVSVVHAMVPQTPGAEASISDVLPRIPTWWIPESAMGFVLLIVMGLMGMWLALTGKRLKRLYASNT